MDTTSLSLAQLEDPHGPGRFRVLLEIARDLTASLAAEDRYQRLLAGVRRMIPADAVCLLRLEGDDLVPLAAHGLAEEARVRRYSRRNHPRLDLILRSTAPVRFPPDSPLPDPFDGMLASDPGALQHIHACLGCALTDGGEAVGALTADALEPHRFDHLEEDILAMLGALAGAALRTTSLIERIEANAARKGAVARELQEAAAQSSGGEILGRSLAVRRLMESADLVARSDLPVLITGETGVGKELVARRIHQRSARAGEPLIHVNCAALPESVAESELFGHMKGAFTGAIKDRAGKFEIADTGTLFLDEIGELPPVLQPKLLRALQLGEIQRVGSDRTHHVDVRIIAATNRDIAREAESGRFRADLYHRLAVYPIRVPALRERREDIPLLAAHFLDLARRRLGVGPLRLTEEAKSRLTRAPWPGNVRELENVISRAALLATAPAGFGKDATPLPIGEDLLDLPGVGERSRTGADGAEGGGGFPRSGDSAIPSGGAGSMHPDGGAVRPGESMQHGAITGSFELGEPADAGQSLRERTEAFQRRVIQAAVARNAGNWAAAARDLGLHRSNLHHLAGRLGLRE